MPVQILCPHCKRPCLVSEQYFGTPVNCSHCAKPFVVPAPVAAPPTAPHAPAPALDPGSGSRLTAGSFRLEISCATSVGRVRNRNEDSHLVQHLAWANQNIHHEVALVVVADGMGGYEAGDLASGYVIRNIGASLLPLVNFALVSQFPDTESAVPPPANPSKPAGQEYSLLSGLQSILGGKGGGQPAAPRNSGTNPAYDTSPTGIVRAIEEAIANANRIVHHKGNTDPKCKGMGATAAVLVIWEGQVLIGHVGDCRVYLSRTQQLTQVTKDQTLVARMIELGQLTPREALSHPSRNEVSQAVGRRNFIEPGRYELQLARKDWLIVACDGLHTHVDEKMLQDAINQATSASQLANQLVNLTNQHGGSDNTTVVAIRCY